MIKELLTFNNLRYNLYVFVACTVAFIVGNTYMLWPVIKDQAASTVVLTAKLKNMFQFAEAEKPEFNEEPVELSRSARSAAPIVPVKQTAAPRGDGKNWCEGTNLEWRVPEGVSSIKLKYKEPNGRLILDYDFKVEPRQRIEIQAQ